MMPRLCLLTLVPLVLACMPSIAPGQGKLKKLTAAEIQTLLDKTIDVRPLTERVKFKTALEFLTDRTATKGKAVAFVIDQKSFTADMPDFPNAGDMEVALPAEHPKMTLRTALYLLVNQAHPNATFTLQPGAIEITTWTKAKNTRAQVAYPAQVKPTGAMLAAMNTPIDTKSLQKPVALGHALAILAAQFAAKKKAFPVVLVNHQSFQAQGGADAPDIRRIEVKLPAQPQKMILGNALLALVKQASPKDGTLVFRQGFVEIRATEGRRLVPGN